LFSSHSPLTTVKCGGTRRTPTLKKISDLARLARPLTFADALVCAIEPPRAPLARRQEGDHVDPPRHGGRRDPVATDLVASLGRPGGNITGLTSISPDMEGKRLELLREVIPSVSHIAVLWNAASPIQVIQERETRTAAHVLRMNVLSLGVRTQKEIEDTLAMIVKERPGALLVLADRLFLHHRARIMDFATKQCLPGVHAYRELVKAGGLMSFGPSYADMNRRPIYFVDRILKGAKPADLPVEQPTKFELVINLKTAKDLGLTIPPTLLFQVDEVIR